MSNENSANGRNDNESEFLRLATDDSTSRRQTFGQVWLMCWVAVAFLGAILIGQSIALGELPWSSMSAAEKYTGMPAALLFMLKIEDDLGGRPGRLFLKLLWPILIGMVGGLAMYSPLAEAWISRVLAHWTSAK